MAKSADRERFDAGHFALSEKGDRHPRLFCPESSANVRKPVPVFQEQPVLAVLFLTSDLMIASHVEGAAQRCGVALMVVPSLEALSQQCQADEVALVLVDLTFAGLEMKELVTSVEAACSARPAIVAFGPHVHANRLEAAREAGCDEVMSRGALHAQIDELLRRYG